MKNKILTNLLLFCCLFSLFLSSSVLADESIYELNAKKIIYTNDNNIITAQGDAVAKDQFGKEIYSEEIIYDKSNFVISTKSRSTFKDTNGNILNADKFRYDLKLKLIQADNNVVFIDKEGNKFFFSKLNYNQNLDNGKGINFRGNLIDNSWVEGSIAEFDNKNGILKIGEDKANNFFDNFLGLFSKKNNTYTPCKNKENYPGSISENCPDWSVDTKETIHDKNKKMVYHYGSIVKIRNIPVFYTPYFSHPDPSVKRKSGFLPLTLKNSSTLGQAISTPYFWAISENDDITFTPIEYFNEYPLFLLEYRKQNTNSRIIVDTSFTQGYKNLTKRDSNNNLIERTDGSRNHFFLNFLGTIDDLIFDKNDIEINIQRISQKNYLNVYQINTQYLREDITNLNNNIIISSYEENKKWTTKANIYENLTIEDRNTKYQYTYPSIEFSNFFNKFNNFINIKSSFSNINSGGDSNQIFLNNKIDIATGKKNIQKIDGLTNELKFSINNVNFYNQNISNQDENFSPKLYVTGAIENSYPLMKVENKSVQTIIPKTFLKYTSGSMTNDNSADKKLSYSDVFSMNRMNNVTNPETGASLGYGVEYDLITKDSKNKEDKKANISLGQVLQPKKNINMPSSSKLIDRKSAFVGSAYFSKNFNDIDSINFNNDNKLSLRYDYIFSNDFSKMLKNSITSNLNYYNNNLQINYYETHEIGNEDYIKIDYQKKLESNINFGFGTRRNLNESFTEYNYIETNYDSDCLRIGLSFSKKFYENSEIKPTNNITFSIMLKPFGTTISPGLSSFLN